MSVLRFTSHLAAYFLAPFVAYYIRSQRDRLEPMGSPLPESCREQFRNYFSDVNLRCVRVVQADPLPIPDPPLYSQLHRLGLDFPSPSMVAAITFDHIIASRVPMNSSLLFHELVHVVQFRMLGVMRFSRLYIRGFLSGGSYDGIPLERCAFELERRFETAQFPFSVEGEAAAWMKQEIF